MTTPSLRSRVLVAFAAITRFGSGVLMGTGLAYFIGASGGSTFAVGMVQTAYWFGLMLFAPLWGAIADVTGRQRGVLVATGVGATLAAGALVVFDPGPWGAIGLRGIYAAFAAGFPPVMLTIASSLGGTEKRGRELGFYNSARAAGFTGGQLAAGFVVGIFLPADLYIFIVVTSLASTLAVARLGGTTERKSVNPNSILTELRGRLIPAREDRAHLRTNGLRWLYVALALRNVTVLGVMALMPVYLPQRLGVTELQMGALLALNHGLQVGFNYLFGHVADTAGRKVLITTGMAGSAAFTLVAAASSLPGSLVGRLAISAFGFVLLAASFSAMTTGSLAFIGDVAPKSRASELMGLQSTAKGVGGVLGPTLVGALAALVGVATAFAIASVLAGVAAVLVTMLLVESFDGSGTVRTVTSDD
ncbi:MULTISPECIES: MFS transporter [Haloferax]|uniref:MFS transporter n=1 Tax=Haloferax TaxID=2251 RepID=UPI0017869AAE|nr:MULTISPECIES: MFS transporter [Haloferax]